MKMTDKVVITCYNKTEMWIRKDALKYFKECERACEGSERERYMNIVDQLEDGKVVCSDLVD